MPEVATAEPQAATEPVSVDAPAQTVKVDYTTMTAAEKFSKIENPKTLKDFLVNSMLDAATKIDHSVYNGTNGQKDDLIDALHAQAFYCKMNDKDAFFTKKSSDAFEINLRNKDSASLKTNREYILKRLTEAEGYPSDPKVAAEYTAIVTASLDNSIRTIAAQVGAITQDPKKPIEVPIVDNSKDETVKVSVPQQ